MSVILLICREHVDKQIKSHKHTVIKNSFQRYSLFLYCYGDLTYKCSYTCTPLIKQCTFHLCFYGETNKAKSTNRTHLKLQNPSNILFVKGGKLANLWGSFFFLNIENLPVKLVHVGPISQKKNEKHNISNCRISSNISIVGIGNIDTPSTQKHDHSPVCLGTGTSSAGAKLVSLALTSSLVEMMRSCKPFPHVSKLPTLAHNQTNSVIMKNDT